MIKNFEGSELLVVIFDTRIYFNPKHCGYDVPNKDYFAFLLVCEILKIDERLKRYLFINPLE